MFLQTTIVTLIVITCTAYAAWTLMPSAARRGIARVLLKWPLPHKTIEKLQKHLVANDGCGCDGCDHGAKKREPSRVQPIRFHPRVKR